jgi:hypothetical protein
MRVSQERSRGLHDVGARIAVLRYATREAQCRAPGVRTSEYARMRCLESFKTDERIVHRWAFLDIESRPVISSGMFSTKSRLSLGLAQLAVPFQRRPYPALCLFHVLQPLRSPSSFPSAHASIQVRLSTSPSQY